MNTAYGELARIWCRVHRFEHLQAIAGWDQAALMPPEGSSARALAMAEMEGLLHEIRTDPKLTELLRRADAEDLDPIARANLCEIRRDWRAANALPRQLVEEMSVADARCEHAWRVQRPANDWLGFLENFREVLTLSREAAQRLSDQSGLAPYDALMDRFEPGTTSADVDRVFGDMQQWLPGLVVKVREKQAGVPVIEPVGTFSKAA